MSDRVGDIVHYVSYGTPGGEYTSKCRAAVVTEACPDPDGCLGLAILSPTGMFFNQHIGFDQQRGGGTWHHLEDCDE